MDMTSDNSILAQDSFFDLTFACHGHILAKQLNGEPAATG
jgi:hypothetical protein